MTTPPAPEDTPDSRTPSALPQEGVSAGALAVLLCQDQRQRWARGERPRIEDYLARYPSLGADTDALLALILGEFLLREQHGEAPAAEEYLQRFPDQAEGLRQVLNLRRQLHVAVQRVLAEDSSVGRTETPSLAQAELPTSIGRGGRPTHVPSTVPTTTGPAPGAPEVVVAGYEVLGLLGKGGMGVVYQARQLGLDRVVALKMILHGALASSDDRRRLYAEAQAVARLQHPNIVQVYEVGESRGLAYFSMELCRGGSLLANMDGTPWAAPAAARLVAALAGAMQAAHQAGVIHRDLKPANVLLTEDGTPKVSDFGLARLLDQEGKTGTGEVLGTPSYMAPEQAAGKSREIGPAADVWALGAILFELLTGRPPFKGASALETVEQVKTQDLVPPRRLQPKVPRDLETICLKCLEKDQRRRYAAAADLAEDLRRYLAGEPIAARPTPWWERARKWARRRPAAAALVALCGAALAGLVGEGAWRNAQLRAAVSKAVAERDKLESEKELQTRTGAAQGFLLAARDAEAKADWPEARVQASQALALAQRAPPLPELQAQAQRLLGAIQGKLDQQQRAQKFWAYYRQAWFHANRNPFLEQDLLAGLEKTRGVVRSALEQVGVRPDPGTKPALDSAFEEDRARLLPACYDLLLLLAQAEAYPVPPALPEDQRRRLRRALEILALAEQLCPTCLTRAYYLRLAEYAGQLGELAAAEDALSRVPRPHRAIDYFFRGEESYRQSFLAQGKEKEQLLSEAIADLGKTLREQPNHFGAHYLLAASYLQLPHRTPAHVQLALQDLNACVGQDARFLEGYLLRGFANGVLGDFQAADADFQKALDLQPQDALTRYVLYVHRGSVRLRQQRLDQAIDDFQQARQLRPDQYAAYLNLAAAYRQRRQPEQARAVLREALARLPNEPQLYRAQADLLEPGDRDGALQAIDQAIALEAAQGRSHELALDRVRRGRLLIRAQRYADAVADFRQAEHDDPDCAEAHFFRGQALLQRAQDAREKAPRDRYYKEAAEAFELCQGKTIAVPAVEVWRGCAQAHAKLKNYSRAVEAYSRALALKGGAVDLSARGWVYLASGASELAERDFDAALRLDDKNADAYSGRGNAGVRLGRTAAAVADASKAVELSGGQSENLWKAARVFAQAAARVRADAARNDPRARKREELYCDQAVLLLRQARHNLPPGPRWRSWYAEMVGDPALDPIRGRLEVP
jgi:Flp pilus assembly protein TadD/predicted Ser/Thr protein kinase